MQQVIVQIDWYTKFVLTLIAVLLAGILVKVNIVSRPAGASEEAKAMAVEITRVNLHWTDFMPVKVINWPKG